MKNHKGLISLISVIVVAIIVIFGGIKMHQSHQASVKREQATSMIKNSNAGKKAANVINKNHNMNSNNMLALGNSNNQQSKGNTVYLTVSSPINNVNKNQMAYLAQAGWDLNYNNWFNNFSKNNPARVVVQCVTNPNNAADVATIATGTTKSSKLNLKCHPKFTPDVKYFKDSESKLQDIQSKMNDTKARKEADKQNTKDAKYASKKASNNLNDPKKFKKFVNEM